MSEGGGSGEELLVVAGGRRKRGEQKATIASRRRWAVVKGEGGSVPRCVCASVREREREMCEAQATSVRADGVRMGQAVVQPVEMRLRLVLIDVRSRRG